MKEKIVRKNRRQKCPVSPLKNAGPAHQKIIIHKTLVQEDPENKNDYVSFDNEKRDWWAAEESGDHHDPHYRRKKS